MGAPMRYQPQGRAVLLPQSGADVAFVRLDQKGLVGTAAITKSGSPTLVSMPYGIGWQFNSTSDQFAATPSWPVLADGTEYTYLVVAVLTSIGNTGLLVCGDNTTRSFQFRVETTGAPSLIGFNTAVSTFTATGTPMTVGVPQTIIARQTKGEVSIWQQGRKTAAASFTGTIKGQAYNEIIVGNRIGAYLRGSIGLVVRWPRALSDAEAAEYSANPWQLFDSGSSSSAYQAAIATPVSVGGTTASGSVSWTEASDTSSLISLVTNRSSITWVESGDAYSLVTLITDRAAISYQDDNDIYAIGSSVSGGPSTMAWTEANDAYTMQGFITDMATLAWIEVDDTHPISGRLYDSLNAVWSESDDSVLITGISTDFGTLSWTEPNDGILFLPSNSTNGSMRRRKGIHK